MQRRRCAAMLGHRGCNDDAAHKDHIPRPAGRRSKTVAFVAFLALTKRGAVLQQQRDQDSGISRKCVQGRVLLRSVEKYLALDAIREASDLHPVRTHRTRGQGPQSRPDLCMCR